MDPGRHCGPQHGGYIPFTRLFSRILLASSLLALSPLSVLAQSSPPTVSPANDTGVNPYETYEGNRENINLSSGNVNVTIPLVSFPGRNGLDYPVALHYDSKSVWQLGYFVDPNTGIVTYNWLLSSGWSDLTAWITPSLFSASPTVNCNGFLLHMPDGSNHAFPGVRAQCVYANSGQPAYGYNQPIGDSSDGLSTRIDATTYTNLIVYLANGTKFYFNGASLTKIEDRNGNIISFTYPSSGTTVISDTLGRKVTITSVSSTASTITYLDSAGVSRTISLTYVSITPTQPPANPPGGYGPTSILALSSVTLPNGLQYSLQYNNSAELSRITYPTGGYAKYDFSAFQGTYSFSGVGTVTGDFREITAKHECRQSVGPSGTCSTEDSTTYTPTLTTHFNGAPYNSQVTTLDPLGNQTLYTFAINSGIQAPAETNRTIYQGTGTVLRTIQTTYSTGSVYTISKTTTLDGGQESQVQSDYETYCPTGLSVCPIGSPNLLEKREYAFAQGAPGPLLRKTDYTYLKTNSVNGQDYTSSTIHILDRPLTEKIYDGSSNLVAQKQFEYDNFTLGLTASGATQHDSSFSTSYTIRGDATAIQRWRNTDGAWLTTRNQFDDAGNVRQTTDPSGNTTTFSYADSWGDTHCTPVGGAAAAYRTSVTNALSQVAHETFNSCAGSVASSTDVNTQKTTFGYDLMNRLVTANFPDGGQTTVCYSEVSGSSCHSTSPPINIVTTQKITSSLNKVSSIVLDGLGRTSQTQLNSDPQGADFVDTAYDALGRLHTVSNPHRSSTLPTDGTTTYGYDALSRTTQVTRPDGATVLTNHTGRATQVQDEGNGTQRVQRISQSDALGRLTSLCEVTSSSLLGGGGAPAACGQDIASTGFLTTYQYDALDNLTQVNQSGLNSRSFIYDSLSRLTSATNPESGTTTYTYDNDGNLLTKTDARGIKTTFAYDALNRLTGKTYSDSTPAVTFNYDQTSALGVTLTNTKGRKSSESTVGPNATGAVFSYDSMGRVVDNSQCTPLNCGGGVFSFQYPQYDFLGNLLAATNAAGVTVNYSYNGAARLTTMTTNFVDGSHPGTLFSNAHYGPLGLTSDTLGNGIAESISYNNRGWLKSFAATSGSNTRYSFSIGTFAPNGDILAANDTANGNWTYTYDPFNRLLSSNTTGQAYTYDYDRFGNRWHQNGPHSSQLGFDANNHIIAGSGVTYDANGNVTADGNHTYTYDAENRISSVDAGTTASYVYDAEGRRARKTTASAGSVDYLYDLAGHQVAEVGATGVFNRRELYAGNRHLATYTAGQSGSTFFTHSDWLGTERARTDMTGATCESIASLPFGDGQSITGSCGDVSPMHFTGKERDSESGLDNFGARYMSSSMGRFVSADPITVTPGRVADPQQLNLYSYVRNNPLRLVDPTGMLIDDSQLSDKDKKKWQKIQDLANKKDKDGNYVNKKLHDVFDRLQSDKRTFTLENSKLGSGTAGKFTITEMSGNDFTKATLQLDFKQISSISSTTPADQVPGFNKFEGIVGNKTLELAETFGHEGAHGVFALDNTAEEVGLQGLLNQQDAALKSGNFPLPPDVMQKINDGLAKTEKYAQQVEKIINGELQAKENKKP